MIHKLKIVNKRRLAVVIAAAVCLIGIAAIIVVVFNTSKPKGKIEADHTLTQAKKEIEVTADDLKKYRQMLGSDLDEKRAVVIIFNTKEECDQFISEDGGKENVLTLGKGILPQMQEQNGVKFYNVVGNSVLEHVFDTLKDGEYSKTAVAFGGVWCYIKRLDVYSVTKNDEDLKAFIKTEKAQEKIQKGSGEKR